MRETYGKMKLSTITTRKTEWCLLRNVHRMTVGRAKSIWEWNEVRWKSIKTEVMFSKRGLNDVPWKMCEKQNTGSIQRSVCKTWNDAQRKHTTNGVGWNDGQRDQTKKSESARSPLKDVRRLSDVQRKKCKIWSDLNKTNVRRSEAQRKRCKKWPFLKEVQK